MSMVFFDGHVQGVSHEAKGLVCQDFSGAREVEGARGVGHVVVVADGHGDPTCWRSDRGSRIAVGTALACLADLARQYLDADEDAWSSLRAGLLRVDELGSDGPDDSDGALPASTEVAESVADDAPCRRLAHDILGRWRAAVMEDYAADPLPELAQAMAEADEAWRNKATRRLYGTTLVAALMLPDLSLLLQQGDGCATVVFADGRTPLAQADLVPGDELCVGNVTTSLSDADSEVRMRFAVLDAQTDPVSALFVGTDGVDKSLPGKDGAADLFAGIALDVLARVEGGAWDDKAFDADLEGVMRRLSASGSGDDVSMAAVMDVDLVRDISRQLRRERDLFELRTTIETDKARLGSMTRKYEYYRTLQTDDEMVERERDAYMSEYRRLGQRIQSLERDLGQCARDGEASHATIDRPEEEAMPENEPGPTDVAARSEQAASPDYASTEPEAPTSAAVPQETEPTFGPTPPGLDPAPSPMTRRRSSSARRTREVTPSVDVAKRWRGARRESTPGRIAMLALIAVLAVLVLGGASYLFASGCSRAGDARSTQGEALRSEPAAEATGTDGPSADDGLTDTGEMTGSGEESMPDGGPGTSAMSQERAFDEPDEAMERAVERAFENVSLTNGALERVASAYPEEVEAFRQACRRSCQYCGCEVASSYDEDHVQLVVRYTYVPLGSIADSCSESVGDDPREFLRAVTNRLSQLSQDESQLVEESVRLSLRRDEASQEWAVTQESMKGLRSEVVSRMDMDSVIEAMPPVDGLTDETDGAGDYNKAYPTNR